MAKDRLSQPANEIIKIKRKFWQSKSRPSRFKKVCARVRQKGVPTKSGYLTAIGSSGVKTVADGHTHA